MAARIKFQELSTGVITSTFEDASGDPVAPTAATWSLSTAGGAEINSRTDIAFSSLAASVDTVLSGDDLQMVAGATVERIFTVKSTYNAPEGNGLPLNGEFSFDIDPLVNLP
jgi:hypothetical protein